MTIRSSLNHNLSDTGTIQLDLGSAGVSPAVFGVPPKTLRAPALRYKVSFFAQPVWPARRQPVRPGRSRSPEATASFRPKRAFTLIELTISAAVASIILVASYLCLSAGVASQKMIEPRVEALQSARVALAMMSADLRSACSLSPDFDFVGEARTLGDMEADNLDFATHYYTPARSGEGDYCQVSYYVDKSRGSEHFSLWRRRNPHIAPDPLTGGSKEEIAPGVRGLTLEYYDGLDWYDTWGDASVNKKTKYTTVQPPNLAGFPEAVRITLLLDPDPGKIADKAGPPLVFQTVVRLELADVQAPSSSSGNTTPADGSNGAQGGQNTPGGAN